MTRALRILDLVFVVLALIVMGVLLPYGVDIPLNDDWVYAKDVLESLNHGFLSLTGFEAAWSLPQIGLGIAISKWLGFSFVYLRLVSILGLFGVLFLSFLILRLRNVEPRTRLICLLSLLSFAPLFVVSFSFMSDSLFLFFWIAAAYFWEKALMFSKKRDFLVGFVFAGLAISQRQFGVFLVLALCFTIFFSGHERPWRLKRLTVLIAFFLAVLTLGIQFWWQRQSLKMRMPLFPSPRPDRVLKDLHATVFYWGWLVLPFTVEIIRKLKLSSKVVKIGIVFGGLTLLRWFFQGGMPYFGNQLSEFGIFRENEVLFGSRLSVFSGVFGFIFTFVTGSVGLLSLTGALPILKNWKKHLKSPSHKFGQMSLVAVVVYFGFTVVRAPLFDRYLLIAIVPCFILAVSEGYLKITNFLFAMILAAASLIGTFVLTDDYLRWNEVKWQAAEFAGNDLGCPLDAVDGGYEWIGWKQNRYREPNKALEYPLLVSFSENAVGFNKVREFKGSGWITKSVFLLEKDVPESRRLACLKVGRF